MRRNNSITHCMLWIMAVMVSVCLPVTHGDWQLAGDPTSYTFSLQPVLFNADVIAGTSSGLRVLIQDQWITVSSDNCQVTHGLETPQGEILVTVRDSESASRICRLNPDPLELETITPCNPPLFFTVMQHSNRVLLGTTSGMIMSLDCQHWFPVEHFSDATVQCATETSSPHQCLVQSDNSLCYGDLNDNFNTAENLGTLEYEPVNEASGIAASSLNPGVFWTHNDSGGSPCLYAFNSSGEHLGVYTLESATNRDWEDMALATVNGISYLYAGDIGDNNRVHETKYIYRVPEPIVDPQQTPGTWTLTNVETLSFQYPDTLKFDAETVMVESGTGNLFVVTKRNHNNSATDDDDDFVYTFPWVSRRDPIIAQFVSILDIPVSSSWGEGYGATGGDIDPSNSEIVVKTYDSTYLLQRQPGQSLASAFTSDYQQLPYTIEPQGEAICWAPDGTGFYTTSEEPYSFLQAHLYHYQRNIWTSTSTRTDFSTMISTPDNTLLAVISNGSNSDGIYQSCDDGQTWNTLLWSNAIASIHAPASNDILMGWNSPVEATGLSHGIAWFDRNTFQITVDNVGLGNLVISGFSTGDAGCFATTSKGIYQLITAAEPVVDSVPASLSASERGSATGYSR